MLFVISLIRAVVVKQHETNRCVHKDEQGADANGQTGWMYVWMYGWSTSDGLRNSI